MMYLHVGEDILVRTKDIIAILDKDSIQSPDVGEFLQQKGENVINLAKGPFKSVVITDERIYYSPLASGTLKKRSQKLSVHEF
ncbi:extracellular matrix regulator RemB [Bacillus sp. V3-13]|uniref:extracellular matrix regulator RemB n=1 Tax=Bacillus sp. V3-13 TaxID=2053728 RepID=UPI00268FA575